MSGTVVHTSSTMNAKGTSGGWFTAVPSELIAELAMISCTPGAASGAKQAMHGMAMRHMPRPTTIVLRIDASHDAMTAIIFIAEPSIVTAVDGAASAIFPAVRGGRASSLLPWRP